MLDQPSGFFNFTHKVVLVTGGGSGLGAGIARRFALAGASVVVNYHTSADAAVKLVAEINAKGGKSMAVHADVTDPASVEQLIRETVVHFGRLDVLVNNAGIYPLTSFLELDPGEWDQVVAANLGSTFLCTQAAARHMISQGDGGAVVNIASIEGINPAPGHCHYNAAKGGVLMATKSMAAELGGHSIRVNAVSPGLIWREGLDEDWPNGVERYKQAAPLGRLGQPEDVADACLFLASPAARWVTGINLIVDGGVMTHQIF
jgi:NAD(P)-dependent dehydrogenase (short-subunit alcohol dehydrogenase family)